jgi:hypothetical protein
VLEALSGNFLLSNYFIIFYDDLLNQNRLYLVALDEFLLYRSILYSAIQQDFVNGDFYTIAAIIMLSTTGIDGFVTDEMTMFTSFGCLTALTILINLTLIIVRTTNISIIVATCLQ